MKNIILLVLLGFGFIGMESCRKVLEEEPRSFVSPNNFYNNPDQVLSSIVGAYNDLWEEWGNWAYGWDIFKNDDQFQGGNLVIPPDWATSQWNYCYHSVMDLNGALRAIKDKNFEADEETMNSLEAQAKILRGWNYFMLVRMFGGVPLITEDIEDPANAEITRASVEEVYDLIVSDFKFAADHLPASWPGDKRGRPTRDAAKGFLAKAYLTMATYPLNKTENYAKAASVAKEAIDAGVYDLVYDVFDVFGYATKYGPEMMWSFNSNEFNKTTSPQVWSQLDGWGDYAADPLFVLGDTTFIRDTAIVNGVEVITERDTIVVRQGYPKQPRRSAYVQEYPRNITDSTGQHFTELGFAPGQRKFQYDPQENWDAIYSTINMPLMRFADVLLIFAEADNMATGGPTQAAVDAINRVIDRANGWVENPADPRATVNMTKEEFDAKVIQERSWELCWEAGDRWFDIIRKRILPEVTRDVYLVNFSEDDYLFPLPSTDLMLNPLLVQNPGYPSPTH